MLRALQGDPIPISSAMPMFTDGGALFIARHGRVLVRTRASVFRNPGERAPLE
jgi:hypothetical protein